MAQGGRQVSELLAMAIAEPSKAEEWARRLLALRDRPRGSLHGAPGPGRGAPRPRDARPSADRDAHGGASRAADRRHRSGVGRSGDARLDPGHRRQDRAGLTQLERARSTALDATIVAKILLRRGHLMYFFLTRPHDALQDLEQALPIFRDTDDRIWTARTLNLVGLCQIAVGRADLAAQAVREAEEIFTAEGQDVESVVTLHNRGWIAWCQGNVPVALRLYDEAADRLRRPGRGLSPAGVRPLPSPAGRRPRFRSGRPRHPTDRSPARSRRCTRRSCCSPWRTRSSPPATTRLLSRTPRGHAGCSGPSVVPGGLSERSWRALLGQHGAGDTGRRLVRAATSVARGLDEYGSEEAAVAWLLAGRFALSVGSAEAGRPCLTALPRTGKAPPASSRGMGWQARALQGEVLGDGRMVPRLVPTGAGILDAHRGTLGAPNSGRSGHPAGRRARRPSPSDTPFTADRGRFSSGASAGGRRR